jgi:lysophospholipase L1-like esterase
MSRFILLLTVLLTLTSGVWAESVKIKNGDRLAILGDSITEQKMYSCYVAVYLMACSGLEDIRVFQFGWGGERAAGMVDRMYNDVLSWNPTVMTTCYGMNDGGYKIYDAATGNTYRDNMQKIIDVAKKHNAQIVIGTPGIVDLDTYKRNNISAAEYNQTLGELAKIDAELAAKNNVGFANVFDMMTSVAKLAKAKLGSGYHVSGQDGVHPSLNGHLIMAYVFLKALGMDGKIANIAMDFKGAANVSAGHKISQQSPGSIEIESKRYPFCFSAPSDVPSNLASILPYLPFQQDLNVFELRVTNLPKARAVVQWGEYSKQFSREELEKGINLAAEFQLNPFSGQFAKIMDGVKEKQQIETWMVKGLLTNFRLIKQIFPESEQDAEMQAAILYWRRKLHEREGGLFLNCKRLIIPIVHRITVTPAE